MDVAPKTSPKQNIVPFGLISPRSRSRSRRVGRSTVEQPRGNMFKPHKKSTILDEYNHAMNWSAARHTTESGTRQEKNPFKPISVHSNDEPIKKVLIWTKLIEFSERNPSTEAVIGSWLSSGWYSPTDAHKKRDSVYRSKMESHITCASLSQCLNYTFQEYMRYEWAKRVYRALMMQLTLPQKALLFWMGSQRPNTKTKALIAGKDGVQWMIDHAMAQTRQEAVTLGHEMVDASYLTSTTSHTPYFEDNDSIMYQLDADSIQDHLVYNTHTPSHTPQTPQSQYGNIPPITMKHPVIIAMDRLYQHNKLMQSLVEMTVMMSPNGGEYLMDNLQCAFYFPSAANSNRYVCRKIDHVAFDLWHEAIQFALTEFWGQSFAQNIYKELLTRLNVLQRCKLMSIGVEVQTRKWRLKKYKDCFIGCEAIHWLMASRLVADSESAMQLANDLCKKGLIKHIVDESKPFKNDATSLYRFDIAEMDRQSRTHLLGFNKAAMVSKFMAHEEWIQHLISMGMTSAPMAENPEIALLLDLSQAFYLPRSQDKYSKFVSKLDASVVFENVIEALHYMLMEKWHEEYSQIVYRKLLNKLSVAQKAKLFSLGMEHKTKSKHFRKYKHCIVGNEACGWLVAKGFCNDSMDAVQLGNAFYNRAFIKHVLNNEHHNNSQYEFKNETILYQLNDIEINKQCIMESYKKRRSNDAYVDEISPCQTDSNAISFPDIDYDVTDCNKVLSFEYKSSNEEKEKEKAAAPDISSFRIQRTPPIKISQSKSKSSLRNLVYGAERVQRHHEMNNLSVYSNMAVNESQSSNSNTSNTPDMIRIPRDDIVSPPHSTRCIMPSITADTPEPHVDFGVDSEYFVSTTPVATPSDESKPVKSAHHNSMATRISMPSLDGYPHHSLLPIHLTIDINKEEIVKQDWQDSKSLELPLRLFQFTHHIINSTASTDVPMDDNIFGDLDEDQEDLLLHVDDADTTHFTQISNSDNPFTMPSYNTYVPQQIGV